LSPSIREGVRALADCEEIFRAQETNKRMKDKAAHACHALCRARKAVTAMLTRIVCPSCGHVGATAMSLPRVLICSQCGHGAFIKSGKPTRSPILTREERAAERAAWERYEAADALAKDPRNSGHLPGIAGHPTGTRPAGWRSGENNDGANRRDIQRQSRWRERKKLPLVGLSASRKCEVPWRPRSGRR
jgi:hypothetical protein